MRKLTSSLSAFILITVLVLGPVPFALPKIANADTPDSGLIGNVINIYESYVEDASVKLSCTDSWYTLGYTDIDGNYEFTIEDILGFFGDSGCEDGSQLRITIEKEHYYPIEEQVVATINFAAANAETLGEWAEWYFNTLRTHSFVSTPRPAGWYGEVIDDDTYEPIAGATLTVSCSTQDSSRVIATSSEDGTYEITQNQFVAQLNSIGCYYDNSFDVVVVASYDGYEDDLYTESNVSGSDMGASFDEPMEVSFYLYPEPIDPATYYAEGDGSENNPFIVDTVERFEGMGDFPEYAEGIYFALDVDITLGEEEGYIGNFSGVFDGRNHTITGNDRSLFGRLQDDAVVKNLLIDTVIHYDYSESNIGILTGRMEGQSYVENVHASGSINVECGFSVCDRIGGLVGEMSGTSRIYRSSSSADLLSSGDNVFASGGLVGFMNGGSIEQSYATGDVYAVSGAGGLVGSVNGTPETTRVIDSYATGNVYTRGQYYSTAAGFVGELGGGLVMRSYSTGSVFASTTPAGGFVGEVNSEDAVIANSFSIASEVEGNGEVGGFMGSIYAGEVRNSAWLREIGKDAVGFVDGGSACGLNGPLDLLMSDAPCNFGYDIGTLDEFKHNGYGGVMAPMYLDGEDSWDFGNVWGFDEDINNGLPYLLWGTDWEPDDNEVVTPPTSGGSSTSGGRGSGMARAVQAVASGDIVALLAQINILIAQHIARGGEMTSLMQAFLAANNSTRNNSQARDLDVGSVGDDVKALQNVLISQGYSIPAGATGLFQNQTRAALSAYQAANNIDPAVGYFGSITRAFMKSAGLAGLWW